MFNMFFSAFVYIYLLMFIHPPSSRDTSFSHFGTIGVKVSCYYLYIDEAELYLSLYSRYE